LDISIFRHDNDFPATFQKPTPITYLRQLADKAEEKFLEENKLDKAEDSDYSRKSYYFYTYFNAYLKAAAINDQIDNLHFQQAIDKIASKPVDTHYLARVITYFFILKSLDKLSISYIRKAYKECFYPKAKKTLLSKFKVQFKAPKISTNFFKPKLNPTITKNTVKASDTTEPEETNQTPSNSSTIDDDDIIMSDSNTNQELPNINQDTENPISEPNLNQTSATLPSTTSYSPFQ
jgi:hypothetical protein